MLVGIDDRQRSPNIKMVRLCDPQLYNYNLSVRPQTRISIKIGNKTSLLGLYESGSPDLVGRQGSGSQDLVARRQW